MGKFGEEWQFPCAFAALDGSHVPIKWPNGGGAQGMKQYFTFKGFNSIVLMVLVDTEYRFIWASVGALGNTMVLPCRNPLIFGKELLEVR